MTDTDPRWKKCRACPYLSSGKNFCLVFRAGPCPFEDIDNSLDILEAKHGRGELLSTFMENYRDELLDMARERMRP